MDEMEISEIPILTKYLEYAEVASWSQTRQIMLSTLKPYLKNKNIKPDEFFPLPIDDTWHEKEHHTTEIDQDAMKWWKNYINKQKGND